MIHFQYIKYGVLIAMTAILFGGFLGLSFGCCEDDIKGALKAKADAVSMQKYEGKQDKIDKVLGKAWVYLKRAHLHSQTMGVIAIALSLLIAGLNFHPKIQTGVSLLSGLGSLGYGVFWLGAAALAPAMGSTDDAKEAVGLIAQASGGSFFVACLVVFAALFYRMFINRDLPSKAGS